MEVEEPQVEPVEETQELEPEQPERPPDIVIPLKTLSWAITVGVKPTTTGETKDGTG